MYNRVVSRSTLRIFASTGTSNGGNTGSDASLTEKGGDKTSTTKPKKRCPPFPFDRRVDYTPIEGPCVAPPDKDYIESFLPHKHFPPNTRREFDHPSKIPTTGLEKVIDHLGNIVMVTMAKMGLIFDGTSVKLSPDVKKWRKSKTGKNVILPERHMINAGKSTSVYHCYDLEDESLDKSGFVTYAQKSFCTRENYSSNKEQCLRVKTRPEERTWPLPYDEKKICVVVHNVDHTDEDDRKPVLVTFVNDVVAENPTLIEDGLGVDFSTDIDTAVKIETNHGGISYYTHTWLHLLQVPNSSSRFHGGHNLEALVRTSFGLLVEAGYQAKTRAHRGKVYEPLHSRILGGMVEPWEDNIDANLAEHVKKFAESETGIHGRGMLVTPDEETPSALPGVGWIIYPALSSWKWEVTSKPADDVDEDDVMFSTDEDDTDVKFSKDQSSTDLVVLTPLILDMHFGQHCKDMKCKDRPDMIKLPQRDMPTDEGINAGFTKDVYWRDLFTAEFDINNPKPSIGKKECIQAKMDLDIHVSGIYTTHGDPYTDTVYTMIDDNVVFFEVCKPILEKEEKSELKLEHSDMESYLRETSMDINISFLS